MWFSALWFWKREQEIYTKYYCTIIYMDGTAFWDNYRTKVLGKVHNRTKLRTRFRNVVLPSSCSLNKPSI